MPNFPVIINIPANTARNAKQRTDFRISEGVIHHWAIDIPPGPVRLIGVEVYQGGHPIIPSDAGRYYTGDARLIEMDDWIPIGPGETNITIYTWNTDTNYDHEVIVILGVMRPWQKNPYVLLNRLVDLLSGLFTRLGSRTRKVR